MAWQTRMDGGRKSANRLAPALFALDHNIKPTGNLASA